MSKMIQGLKSLLGIKTKENCFDQFHKTADRIAAKTDLILAERNNFAHSAKRAQMRGSRKKKESK